MLARVVLFSSLMVVVLAGLTLAWVRGVRELYPEIWEKVRRGLYWALGAWGLTVVAQPVVRWLDFPRYVRVPIAAAGGLGLMAILLTAPFVWLGVVLRRRAAQVPAPSAGASAGLTRRELGIHAARAMPLGGAVIAGAGAKKGGEPAEVVEIEMAYPDLPAPLEGLRILQYSDVHLGTFIDLEEVRAMVEQGAKARPDLVVLTGDIADDLSKLPDALALFASISPRLGVYASIGNHEYFRGLRETRRAYDRSKVRFLLEQGESIDVGGARLHLSGADDPRFLGRQNEEFFARTVAQSLDGAPSDAFHVLMSHRPEGFVAARQAGVQLTLSGHTHGAQLGSNGRSLFERLLPDKYLWGPYQEGAGRLYTSSGAGHWFPYRLGCPRELPVIKLAKGPPGAAAVKKRLL